MAEVAAPKMNISPGDKDMVTTNVPDGAAGTPAAATTNSTQPNGSNVIMDEHPDSPAIRKQVRTSLHSYIIPIT